MNENQEIIEGVLSHVGPVLVGTAVAMWFQPGAWPRRIAQGVVGVPFGLYMAPMAERLFASIGWQVTDTEAGVLTGVFGITLVAYCYEVLKQLQIGLILNEFFRKRLGLPSRKE